MEGIRCRIVRWDEPDRVDTMIECARVPQVGERIELPDARIYAVDRVSWTSAENPQWHENAGLRRPVETRPVLRVRPV